MLMLVVVALSFAAVAFGQDATAKVELAGYVGTIGVDCIGHDFVGCKQGTDMSPNFCRSQCEADARCAGFQWWNPGAGKVKWCCLKNYICTSAEWKKISTRAYEYIFYARIQFTAMSGVDCPGYDLGSCETSSEPSSEQCMQKCLANPDCNSFQYVGPPGLNGQIWCCPKTIWHCPNGASVRAKSNYVHYIKPRFLMPSDNKPDYGVSGYEANVGMDCPGNDLKCLTSDRIRLEDCHAECISNTECRSFVYYNGFSVKKLAGYNQWCCTKSINCTDENSLVDKKDNAYAVYSPVPYVAYTGKDCPGGDIGGWQTGCTSGDTLTQTDCKAKCNENAECLSYLYIGPPGFAGKKTWCCLKNIRCSELKDAPQQYVYNIKPRTAETVIQEVLKEAGVDDINLPSAVDLLRGKCFEYVGSLFEQFSQWVPKQNIELPDLNFEASAEGENENIQATVTFKNLAITNLEISDATAVKMDEAGTQYRIGGSVSMEINGQASVQGQFGINPDTYLNAIGLGDFSGIVGDAANIAENIINSIGGINIPGIGTIGGGGNAATEAPGEATTAAAADGTAAPAANGDTTTAGTREVSISSFGAAVYVRAKGTIIFEGQATSITTGSFTNCTSVLEIEEVRIDVENAAFQFVITQLEDEIKAQAGAHVRKESCPTLTRAMNSFEPMTSALAICAQASAQKLVDSIVQNGGGSLPIGGLITALFG